MVRDEDTSHRKLELGRDLSQDPVTIRPEDALMHTAVVAQSGAGKSTFLARLLEEIVVSRTARVVVLDANGDFRWFAHTRQKADKPFGVLWKALDIVSLDAGKQAIWWWNLDIYDQAWLLGLDGLTHPVELRLISTTREYFRDHEAEDITNSLDLFHVCLRPAAEKLKTEGESAEPVDVALDRVQQATGRLRRWSVWAKTKQDVTLPDFINDSKHDAVVVDLPSLGYPDEQKALAAICLTELWEHAVRQPLQRDTFVILDEAHNFAPADTPDPIVARSSAVIQRIAAEGRKYRLFLTLATQRPSKMKAGLLSDCENVCILRLQSPLEHQLAADTWGLPMEEIACTRGLAKGNGLLAGRWADRPIFFHGADRRTKASEQD